MRKFGTTSFAVWATATAFLLAACSGSQKAAPAASAPAATPTPAPAVTQPAAPSFDKLLVFADMVLGATNVPQDQMAAKVCVQNSRYARNQRVVWRIKVMDPKSGAYLDDKTVGQVEVKLADGQVLQAKYGPHPGKDPTDYFWTAGWTIPENYPSGTVKFDIAAVGTDGRTSKLLDFNVALAFLTVLDAKVPEIKK